MASRSIARLCRGGCRWLSLREKDLAAAERLALLQSLVELGRPYGAVVGVHDDVAAAAATEAALHLPDGVVPAEARRRLGAKAPPRFRRHHAIGKMESGFRCGCRRDIVMHADDCAVRAAELDQTLQQGETFRRREILLAQ